MREPLRDLERVKHIKEACRLLIEYHVKDSLETIKSNPIKFYGYVKLVEIIGEATFKMTPEFRSAHPNIPWKMMEGMRHVLVHDYYMISAEKLWDTITDDIPQLQQLLDKIV